MADNRPPDPNERVLLAALGVAEADSVSLAAAATLAGWAIRFAHVTGQVLTEGNLDQLVATARHIVTDNLDHPLVVGWGRETHGDTQGTGSEAAEGGAANTG